MDSPGEGVPPLSCHLLTAAPLACLPAGPLALLCLAQCLAHHRHCVAAGWINESVMSKCSSKPGRLQKEALVKICPPADFSSKVRALRLLNPNVAGKQSGRLCKIQTSTPNARAPGSEDPGQGPRSQLLKSSPDVSNPKPGLEAPKCVTWLTRTQPVLGRDEARASRHIHMLCTPCCCYLSAGNKWQHCSHSAGWQTETLPRRSSVFLFPSLP